ncbi:MAG: HigA family addiction module antitoxin [Rhodospirillales bacterium]|jgi:antitoxin HigA-1
MLLRAVHPGEVLKEELEVMGVSPTALARQIAVPANRVSQIIAGKRAVTGDTALRLGHWFGTDPQFWLNLQSAYEISLAVKKAGRAIARLPVRPAAASAA